MTKQEKEKEKNDSNSKWKDINQAAEYIKHSVSFIHNNINEIPHYKPKGKLLFLEEELDKWIRGRS
jgi:hypothetical protein